MDTQSVWTTEQPEETPNLPHITSAELGLPVHGPLPAVEQPWVAPHPLSVLGLSYKRQQKDLRCAQECKR